MKRRPFVEGLEFLCENLVVPPGLASIISLLPALKRRAKLDRPSGTSSLGFVPRDEPQASSHAHAKTLLRQNRDFLRNLLKPAIVGHEDTRLKRCGKSTR